MSDELLKLAERVEAAAGPDRELDFAIADAVFGAIKPPLRRGHCEKYTASLDAALTLVPEEYRFDTLTTAYGDWVAELGIHEGVRGFGRAVTGPLALCAAALRARSHHNNQQEKG